MTEPSPRQRALFAEALDLLARKTAADDAAFGEALPYATAPDGSWRALPVSLSAGYDAGGAWSHGNWFSGFWVGLLLAGHVHTGEQRMLEAALRRLAQLAPRAEDGNTHDIGFLFLSSALPAHRLTGDADWAGLGLRAAQRLRARRIETPRGAYLSSWGPLGDSRGRRSSAIDTMCNLPLLFWAADHAGDPADALAFRTAGEEHARSTARAFVRPDGSTIHAVEYDPQTGERTRAFTFQGHADDSCWSRGQAWGIAGFASTAAATGHLEHLRLAERLAEHFWRGLDDTRIPPWDFDDPAGAAAPRDTSAAAIVAGGLLELAALHPDAEGGARWAARALELLEALCGEPLAREESHRGLLKHGCYSRPHRDGVDSAVLFGDYYFAQALCAVLHPGRLTPVAARLPLSHLERGEP